MNIQFPKEKITKRIKIDTGFTCNARCFFCYYKSKLDEPFMEYEKIKKQLLYAKKLDFKVCDFSGGESSYHPQFFEMLNFAKNLGLRPTTLSNGLLFSDKNFIKESKKTGLTEILFSIHGDESIHNKSVKIQNAFDKILKAIENSININIIVRLNITINKLNLFSIKNLFKNIPRELLNSIHQFNFLPINEWLDANIVGKQSQSFLLQNFNKLYEIFDFILNLPQSHERILNIRYWPFCEIDKKYHKFLYNYYHHFFDTYDWHPFFIYYEDFNIKNFYIIKYHNENEYLKKLFELKQSQFQYLDKCKNCNLKEICDGYKK